MPKPMTKEKWVHVSSVESKDDIKSEISHSGDCKEPEKEEQKITKQKY